MISIDRGSAVPVRVQLVDQLRFEIATGRYQIGARLPSTRTLAAQLDLSYHTVRGAYASLEHEGLIEGRGGSGYVVRGRSTTARGERMEAGAAVFQDALRRLVGMGLTPEEMDYLFQEQIEFVTSGQEDRKLVFAAPSRELAELCAAQVGHALQQHVDAESLESLARQTDVEVVFAAFEYVRQVMMVSPRADVQGVVVHLNPDALERMVRLMDDETLGLVARAEDTVPALIAAVRAETDFSGQMLAFSSDARAEELEQLIEQATLIAYTPAARRALLPHLRNQAAHVQIRPIVRVDALESVRTR